MTENLERKKFDISNQPRTTYEAVRQDLSDLSTEALVRLVRDCEDGIERGLREGVRGWDGTNYGPALDGDIQVMMRNAQQTLVLRAIHNVEGEHNG